MGGLCGTPEYVAPEILGKLRCNKTADWWNVGILLYEMVVGKSPFCDDDYQKTYRKILDDKYEVEYPKNVNKKLRDLIDKLLNRKPDERYGAGANGAEEIR